MVDCDVAFVGDEGKCGPLSKKSKQIPTKENNMCKTVVQRPELRGMRVMRAKTTGFIIRKQ